MSESVIPDLGVTATVFVHNETEEPATLSAAEATEISDLGHHVQDYPIVSHWSLHCALYALQNPTPDNITRALAAIGTSGDCEEWCDEDTLRPLPVGEPNGWDAIYVSPATDEGSA